MAKLLNMPCVAFKAFKFSTANGRVTENIGKFSGCHRQNRLTVEGEELFRRLKFGNNGGRGITVVGANKLTFVATIDMVAEIDVGGKFATIFDCQV